MDAQPAPTSVTEYYSRAWTIVREDLVSWVLFYAVFTGVALVTCGLGSILMPNALREVRDALAADRPPAIGALFDMQHLTDDLINYVIWMGAITVGSAAGGIGGSIAAVLLQFQMPLAADDAYAPMDNAKLSFKHVAKHPSDHVIFMLLSGALGMLAVSLCLLPLPFLAPIINVAHWLWYVDSRAELDELAREAGIKPTRQLPGPTL
ncbi:MAG: hypothetical protein H6742_13590 [Alphaproteobacteria bacterium]|nr:hypothetical protein [Alphaproteobacteria bacterium]